MRCEDCLPLVEEYFDGEVTTQTGEQIRAHLAACADCSAALDALSFEQEVYARYDRGGLEVTPDLWARVSAEIARDAATPESPAARRPFLSRARDYVAAVTAAFAPRPALASSLALAVVAVTAGALWLSRRAEPVAPPAQMARNLPPTPKGVEPTIRGEVNDNNPRVVPPVVNPSGAHDGEAAATAASEPRGGARALTGEQRLIELAVGHQPTRDEEQILLSTPSAPAVNTGLVDIEDDEHAKETETAAAATLLTSAPASTDDIVLAADTRPLDPDQKDVARHVERAQMLLRSIKNVRASDEGDIAYEKNLSRQLLAENSTLQLEAEVKGDKETKQVLDRIQPFLLEIANMGEKPSREEVRSIRERVRTNEIVAALEVY